MNKTFMVQIAAGIAAAVVAGLILDYIKKQSEGAA